MTGGRLLKQVLSWGYEDFKSNRSRKTASRKKWNKRVRARLDKIVRDIEEY